MRKFYKKIFFHDKWNVGIVTESLESLLTGKNLSDDDVVWLPEKRGHYSADSFLFAHDGRTWLFYEDFLYKTNTAGLAVVEVLRDEYGTVTYGESQPIIEEVFHQSYPHIFEDKGIIYALPEHSASGTVTLYEATNFPHEWKASHVLLDDFVGVDATPFRYDGMWWMFVSKLGNEENREVELYFAEMLKGRWKKHKMSPVLHNPRGARMAGNIYQDDKGILYRMGQDCSKTYGGGLVIYRIDDLSKDIYTETEVRLIVPFGRYAQGLHTIGSLMNGEMYAIDAKRWADPWEVITKLWCVLRERMVG